MKMSVFGLKLIIKRKIKKRVINIIKSLMTKTKIQCG